MARPFYGGKITCAKYKISSFRRGHNTIYPKTYDDKIVFPEKLQNYDVKWYHAHLLHTIMGRTESMINQNLY